MRNLAHLPILIMVVGGLLLLGALVWPCSKNPQDYWTEADAQERTEAGLQYHAMTHRHAHAQTEQQEQVAEEKLEAARARYKETDHTFQDAQDRYRRPAALMRWSGIACLVVGMLGYYLLRAASG
jgi:hypothetical protein